MEKFFSLFGKLMLVLLVLGGAAGAAFYFGRQSVPPPEESSTEIPAQTATPAPQEASDSAQTVTAGLSAASGLSFGIYTVEIPDGWSFVHDQDLAVPTDTLTVTSGGYSIKIYQAATGGAVCLYPGDPAFEGPSSTFTAFTAITTGDGTQVRRGGTGGGFTICQRSTDGSYQQPTHYGHIQYTTPPAANAQMLLEMDAIIASLAQE